MNLTGLGRGSVRVRNTLCSGPSSGNFIEDGFSENAPFASTLAADVLRQDGKGIALDCQIVLFGEDTECDGSKVGEPDFDRQKGGGRLLAVLVLVSLGELCLSVQDGGRHRLEGV